MKLNPIIKIGMFFLTILLLTSFVLATEQAIEICGGDEELVVLCSGGDENLGYFHNYEDEVTPLGGGILLPRDKEKRNLVIYIICVVSFLLICLFIFLWGKRKNKKEKKFY